MCLITTTTLVLLFDPDKLPWISFWLHVTGLEPDYYLSAAALKSSCKQRKNFTHMGSSKDCASEYYKFTPYYYSKIISSFLTIYNLISLRVNWAPDKNTYPLKHSLQKTTNEGVNSINQSLSWTAVIPINIKKWGTVWYSLTACALQTFQKLVKD